MAFPTTSILDTFNRADENPLGNGTWSGPVGAAGNQLQVLTNQCGPGAFNGSSYWSAATFGPDCEAYCSIPTAGGTVSMHVRLSGAGTSGLNAYRVDAVPTTNVVRVFRIDAGTPTQLGLDITQTVGNGDALGVAVAGSTLSVYYRPSGGAWGLLDTRTDATYTAAGNLGLDLTGNTTRVDDFGGGTVAGAPAVPPPVACTVYPPFHPAYSE